ncbi:MAG: MurT ligase domain-containing protein [Acidimicrobiales bacterium]|jgi:UDP-N-acetylmuramyl tripeptide synthase|nr:MurT ligase domain-containing protein [Acidimicrobiales bacterium]
MTRSPHRSELPRRSRAALAAGRGVATLSRAAHLGSGSVIGGKLALAVDPLLLGRLSAGHDTVLVSGTNGKTTTTHLVGAALRTAGPVASNTLGANMPPGMVAALDRAPDDVTAVLEVDERWLPRVLGEVGPAVVVLLNLSRDQLDRSHEVRKIADTWRDALGRLATRVVVANADDPLVVWAAGGAPHVVWVGAGSSWTADAAGCPACGGRIDFSPTTWRCTACDFARPEPAWTDDGTHAVQRDGPRVPLAVELPGRVNRGNALLALAAADAVGVEPATAAPGLRRVREVAGRYRSADVADSRLRMLLAKNPAGWTEAIDMLAPAPRPVVAAINARIADGRDPSWLWDVPYERLQGRLVVATGERRHDLAVRLRYADVDHDVADSLEAAVRRCGTPDVDLIANYTAFQDYLDAVGREP